MVPISSPPFFLFSFSLSVPPILLFLFFSRPYCVFPSHRNVCPDKDGQLSLLSGFFSPVPCCFPFFLGGWGKGRESCVFWGRTAVESPCLGRTINCLRGCVVHLVLKALVALAMVDLFGFRASAATV